MSVTLLNRNANSVPIAAHVSTERRLGKPLRAPTNARPEIKPSNPFPRLQFQEKPYPEIRSMMTFPTKPVKKPAQGPKIAPKNIGIATAGRIEELNGPGIRINEVAQPNTPY